MAEQVQATLDQMVEPLADLMDRSIFSQKEVHAIVARRRDSEYLLRRLTPRKADFLKYIQDELQLEKLRQLRTKKQQATERERLAKLGRLDEWNQQQTGKKKHIGDAHMIQNIHLLFKRALRKYNKEDVSVYLQYADVCKQLQSYNKLPQVYAEAVQIHPHVAGVWIEAASHEFFHRQSVSAARILLQRALRINPTAKDLWWQYFSLEFHYIAKMQGRKTVLQADTDNAGEGNTTTKLSPTLYAVAKIVYDSAIEAIPDDVSFRLQFLDLCKRFPYTDKMEEHLFKTIRRDFKDSPKAWIARAAHLLEQKSASEGDEPKGFAIAPQQDESSEVESDSDTWEGRPTKKRRTSEKDDSSTLNTDHVLAMIQQAIRAVESSDMYLESVRFLWMHWERVEDVVEDDEEKVEATRQNILHFLQDLLDGAASKHLTIYNVPLALEHAEFYTRVDQEEHARQVLEDFKKAALEKQIDARLTPVWLQLAELTFRTQSAAGARKVLKEALRHTPMSNPDHLQILLHVLGAELAISNMNDASDGTKQKASKAATEAFQKVLLLASSGSVISGGDDNEEDTQDSEETSFGMKTVEQACWQFLLHMIDFHGPVSGARKTCKLVLHQSKFIERLDVKMTQDMETLVAFFDKCIAVEIDYLKKGNKSERKKDKVFVRQLFEAAIRLFNDVPSLASKYKQERLEASLL